MNFPVWEIPYLGGPLLIGIISVFHVFISHFAVGGGLFLVLTERKAYRENNPAMLDYVKKHSKFFLLLTLVLGAVSGVAIWFTIGLVHPSATSALIHTFVWGWAIEWVVFFVEISSIIIYVAMWEKMDRRTHMTIGWIYAVSGFLTLAVINGIVSFMLTPGAWLETKNFWDGILNPTYLPALFSRALACIAFAGVYAFVTATRLQDETARNTVVRYSATWVLPALLLLPFAMWWYYLMIPATAQEIVAGGIPYIQTTATYGIILAALLFFLVFIGPFWRTRSFTFAQSLVLLIMASLAMFTAERVREAIRKPYVLYGYMYSNAVLVSDLEKLQEAGLLQSAKWVSSRAITPENELQVGRELFRIQCASCHTVGGYQDITQQLTDRTQEELEMILSDLPSFKGYMPPFAGNEQERIALAKWLMSIKPDNQFAEKGVLNND